MCMKKFFLIGFLLLFPVMSYAQPSIVFDAENYDLGTVAQNNEIEHTFSFTNEGDKELVIEKLIPS